VVVLLSGLGDLDVFAKTASGGTFTHVSGWPLVGSGTWTALRNFACCSGHFPGLLITDRRPN
jgi:hypothetical protein